MVVAKYRWYLWVIKMQILIVRVERERAMSLQEWWHWCGGKTKVHKGLWREQQQVCGAMAWCHICPAELPLVLTDLNSTENPNIIPGAMYFDFVPLDL